MGYPFGESRLTTAALLTDRLYTGQRAIADFDIGLYHYNARFYSPALGRFVSADTIIPGAGNSQAFNRYSYVFNNPILYNDPTGHCAYACPVIIVSLVVVAAITMVAINAQNPHMWDPVVSAVDGLVQEAKSWEQAQRRYREEIEKQKPLDYGPDGPLPTSYANVCAIPPCYLRVSLLAFGQRG